MKNDSVLYKYDTEKRYLALYTEFANLFSLKGFSIESTFDGAVWFLGNSFTNFKKFVKNEETPLEDYLMVTLLKKVCNSENLTDMKVSTDMFIRRLCNVLFECNKIRERCLEFINSWEADVKKNYIEQTLKIIETHIEEMEENESFVSDKSESHLKVKLNSLSNFPKGKYQLFLSFIETPETIGSAYQTEYQNFPDVIEMNLAKQDESIDLNTFRHLDFGAIPLVPVNLLTYSDSFNGSNIESLSLQISKKNGENYEDFGFSQNLKLIDIFINSLDNLLDLNKTKIEKNFKIDIMTGEKTNLEVNLLLDFEIDMPLRAAVLERVNRIFMDLINEKHKNEIIVSYFIDKLFGKEAEKGKQEEIE